MVLQENLKKLRKEKKLSQLTLGEMLDVSRQTVSRWETGETVPSAENLLALSKLFETPVDELLGDTLSGETLPPEDPAPEPGPELMEPPAGGGEEETAAQPDNAKPRKKIWTVVLAAFVVVFCLVLIVLGKIMRAETITKIFLIFIGALALLCWLIAEIVKKIILKLRKDCK